MLKQCDLCGKEQKDFVKIQKKDQQFNVCKVGCYRRIIKLMKNHARPGLTQSKRQKYVRDDRTFSIMRNE